MARKANPSLSGLLPLLVLGGFGLYLFNKSKSITAPGGVNPELILKIQIALDNLLGNIPGPYTFPQPFSAQFDQATADAYTMAGNITFKAMQDAQPQREILPTGTFRNDASIQIVRPADPVASTLKLSTAFVEWLLRYWYANREIDPYQPPVAYAAFKQYSLKNGAMHPDEKALRDAAFALYPTLFK